MVHTAWMEWGCVLRIIFEECGRLSNEACPISPLLVIFLISTEVTVRSLMSPELLAPVAIGFESVSHWAFLAAAAIPMSCPLRGGWR